MDDHDRVLSVVRSDLPDVPPIFGEVPFFLGMNHLLAITASQEDDIQLLILNKEESIELFNEYPEEHAIICENLMSAFDLTKDGKQIPGLEDDTSDPNKSEIKRRIMASMDLRTEQRFLSLCQAAKTGEADAVVLLARQGANLDQQDYDGRTALHVACMEGNYKVVEVLTQQDANPNLKNRWGHTPLQVAVNHKQQMIVQLLSLSKARLDLENAASALCDASSKGDISQVKRLIENGVNPSSGDYDKRTALHIAAAEGQDKVVEYLLSAKAHANCTDRWGGTPLQDALAGSHNSCAALLKSKGGKVPTSFGAAAVCSAASEGNIPRLRMLHEFGQPMHVGDYDSRFPLHLACAEGRVLAVSFLLGISADPNKEDRWKSTPMDDAVRGGTLYHKYCAKLLQGWGGELGEAYCGTKEGAAFLEELQGISIKQIRELISNLIEQGLDRKAPTRLSEKEMRIVMSSTIRHMPLVKELQQRTVIISSEFQMLSDSLGEMLEHLSGDVLQMIDVLINKREEAGRFRQKTLPDAAIEAPRRPFTAVRKNPSGGGPDNAPSNRRPELKRLGFLALEPVRQSPAVKAPQESSSQDRAVKISETIQSKLHKKANCLRNASHAKRVQKEDMHTILQVRHLLLDSVDDSSVPVEKILECKSMCKSMIRSLQLETELEDVDNATMDSDDELVLYEEIDAMTQAQERVDEQRLSWERVGERGRPRESGVVRGDVCWEGGRICIPPNGNARTQDAKHASKHACTHAHSHAHSYVKLRTFLSSQLVLCITQYHKP
jgi:ankyrin repeat protein